MNLTELSRGFTNYNQSLLSLKSKQSAKVSLAQIRADSRASERDNPRQRRERMRLCYLRTGRSGGGGSGAAILGQGERAPLVIFSIRSHENNGWLAECTERLCGLSGKNWVGQAAPHFSSHEIDFWIKRLGGGRWFRYIFSKARLNVFYFRSRMRIIGKRQLSFFSFNSLFPWSSRDESDFLQSCSRHCWTLKEKCLRKLFLLAEKQSSILRLVHWPTWKLDRSCRYNARLRISDSKLGTK